MYLPTPAHDQDTIQGEFLNWVTMTMFLKNSDIILFINTASKYNGVLEKLYPLTGFVLLSPASISK